MRTSSCAEYPRTVAFSIQRGRNVVMQGLGLGTVSLMGLIVQPWPVVLAWTVAAVAVIGAENHLLRIMARREDVSRAIAMAAPALRVLATTLYAIAAYALYIGHSPGSRLFVFALASASMVHVLMRYYRSPAILLATMSPWIVFIGLIGFGAAHAALAEHQPLRLMAAAFTLAVLALQFWSARAQLAGTWGELVAAREAAEARERAANEANRSKSQFLANMSHELRTPLNGALGMAQALAADPLTPIHQERVGVILQSGERLLAMLDDLLDLSNIETSGGELERVGFDLESLVEGVMALHLPLAAEKGLTCEAVLAEAARGRCMGDPTRVRRILRGLVNNAVKFTERGGVAVRVDRDADHVVFHVSDSGLGIDPRDVGRLFEGFFQADATLARRHGGAGIGLSVCKGLVTHMDGAIEVSSTLGVGSTFTVRLPLPRGDEGATPDIVGRRSATAAPPAALRVLAAEDNAVNQLVIKTLLAPMGITPTFVEDGRQAVAAWEGETWDIILMDIQMPLMSGIDASRAIRRRERETGRPRTPILAVTANAMTHQVEYEAAGMDGVVAKPLHLAALHNAMEAVLSPTTSPEAEQGKVAG